MVFKCVLGIIEEIVVWDEIYKIEFDCDFELVLWIMDNGLGIKNGLRYKMRIVLRIGYIIGI